MGKTYLSTKNNLLKLQNSIKEYKNGQMLIEEKELILKNKLESYKDKEQIKWNIKRCRRYLKKSNCRCRIWWIDWHFKCH